MPSRWRAALRIARRDAARHRGRSLLIVLMVGLPVMLSVGLATVAATLDITSAEDVDRQLGSAQALVVPTSSGPLVQDADAVVTDLAGEDGGDSPPALGPAAADLERRLDARAVPISSAFRRVAPPPGSDQPVDVALVLVDLADPLTQGLVGLEDGRLPRGEDEVVVSHEVARDGYDVGSTMQVDGRTVRVVGSGDLAPRDIGTRVVAASPDAFEVTDDDISAGSRGLLVGRDDPITWADVESLNAAGYAVLSRAVLADPGSVPSSVEEVSEHNAEETAVNALVVACVVIEVALLAGPAFAVGVRTQRRQLALVAAGGGDRSDLTRVVVAGALVLGGLASLVGGVLGVALSPVVAAGLRLALGTRVGPLDVPVGLVVLGVVLGVVAAVLASIVPARQAARRDLVAALGDRPDPPRSASGWPLVGAGLMVVGLLVVLGTARGVLPEVLVAFGAVVLVLGAVLLVPLVIGLVGRSADRLPLSLRLAVRDSSRQRGRSAPAVAAVMAVVAGISALAIGAASDFAQSEEGYVPRAVSGQALLPAAVYAVDGTSEAVDVERLVATALDAVPEHPLVPVRTIASGDPGLAEPWSALSPGCSPAVRGDDCARYPDASVASTGPPVLVATSAEARAIGVDLRAQDARALDAGQALVSDRAVLGDGIVRVGLGGRYADFRATAAPLRLQGAGSTAIAQVVVPPAAAERQDLPVQVTSLVTEASSGTVTSAQATALTEAQVSADVPREWAEVYVERGFTETFTAQFLLLVGAGGLLVLVGTLTATGLSIVDSRSDLGTLSAVGAGPATRRAVAASSALVVGLLGSVLGVVLGVAPGLAAASFLTRGYGLDVSPTYVVPWDVLGLVVVVVPLLAALVCGIAVRGRTPLVRRVER